MIDVLLRRGNLVLARVEDSERLGLYRWSAVSGMLNPVGALDLGEWKWVRECAAPLAEQVLGPDPDVQDSSGSLTDPSVPGQTSLKVDP